MTMYKCSIIADPNGSAWNFAEKVYQELSMKTPDKFELNKVVIQKFRDGEIKPKIEKNVRRKNCFFIHDSSKEPKEWFLEMALILEALKNSSSQEITVVLPFLRFSRQDRKDESRVPISAKVIADVIGMYADRALTLDVHDPRIQGFYNIPFDNLYSFSNAITYLKEKHPDFINNLVVMSPDAGGGKRAEAFAKRINSDADIVVGYKTRQKAGEISNLKITGDVKDKNVLIVDDMVDSGNTLIKAGSAAKEAGAKRVGVYCTHALFTEGSEKVRKCFDFVIVGDTIVNQKLKETGVEVISFAPLFAQAIYRINEGESLSDLFA